MTDVVVGARRALRPMPDLRGVRLADVKGTKGVITGATVDYLSPCTAGERQTCRIVRQLSAWNDLLSDAYLELRKETNKVGFLSLVTVEQTYPPAAEDHKLHRCATIVYWLLKTHRCVANVDVNMRNLGVHYMLLFVALRGNPAVKTLKLGLCTYWNDHQEPRAIASCLENIEELECRLFPDWPSHILSALKMLLRAPSYSSLTSIKIPKLPLRNHETGALLEALVTNDVLKKLSMRGSDLTLAWINHRHTFRRHLVSGCCSLAALSVSDLVEMRKDVFKWLLGCLQENRTITHVFLQRVVVDEDSAAIVTGILVENRVLRCFNMSEVRTDSEARQNDFLQSWLPALCSNDALEEFTLPLSACTGQLWKDFVRLLPARTVTRKITIEIAQDGYHVIPSMYEVLAGTPEAGRLVFFKRLSSLSDSDTVWNEPSQCHAWLFHNTVNVFSAILQRLPSLDHVTIAQFRLSADLLEQTTSSAISSYIRTTRSLKRLCLSCFSLEAGADSTAAFWSEVIESLSSNASLTTVAMRPRYITERAIRSLANVLKTTRNIHTVHIDFEEGADGDSFVSALSPGLTETYVLLCLHLRGYCDSRVPRAWFTVRDTVRRNSGLVSMAAEFVSGHRCDRYCAGALERVYNHVALPERVAQLSSVSEADASAMVRDALGSIQGMHDFMRLAGVVKHRVQCVPSVERRSQLDVLDDDSWRRVRRYLWLDDVLESGHSPSSS
ncbi:hypothetical protein HPB50_008810 [Hyalomma asiaticum]|uniref:Uncharacterized protein n=1 Tax=Hyalomma asiaticum TaxID=266040 RepID=A0ACB7T666_HYAAI|nr:hypothetical protein HPB50_008810 [Hyalomma asiaticum]